MRKILLTAVCLTGVLLSGGAHAALDITCDEPRVIYGATGSNPVVQVDVVYDEGEWSVVHYLASGRRISRRQQYAMRDTSDDVATQWRGVFYKNPRVSIVGEVREINGRPFYYEWGYNEIGLTFRTVALCH